MIVKWTQTDFCAPSTHRKADHSRPERMVLGTFQKRMAAESKISELEDVAIETIHNETQKETEKTQNQ